MTLAGTKLSAEAREWVCLDTFFSGSEGRTRRDLVWRLADRVDETERVVGRMLRALDRYWDEWDARSETIDCDLVYGDDWPIGHCPACAPEEKLKVLRHAVRRMLRAEDWYDNPPGGSARIAWEYDRWRYRAELIRLKYRARVEQLLGEREGEA
jgi:hypothetical protein